MLRQLKPHVVFSKGGFVAFPVVVGAWLNRIPIVAHESDMSPGLANRLSFPFVDKICITFAAASKHFKNHHKLELTGTPIRRELFTGSVRKGLALCGFTNDKPCLLVVGGSQGSSVINRCVRAALNVLCESFQVIHLCGTGHLDASLSVRSGYVQFEYANEDLPDLFAASDIVLSRAGANALCEILALGKPHVLVPLSRLSSRGDQIQNARYFEQEGMSIVIAEEALTPEALCFAVKNVFAQRDEIASKIRALNVGSATLNLLEIIKRYQKPE
ncbi:MAG TPA: UDP-N-acetylglucosamine--N-acetylmuramyl-(pentapeptide) pyrophosphoryl-undecaprenol N-acetylglucosamine transferase [Legionella sp.]|nr:UDP-N-acetylglucosamine--N-acetylmuramyl-(pentapeptide) pyrophosphoryl-undecaprenol N-acetylglucosamine transferase [Legionella sp.]